MAAAAAALVRAPEGLAERKLKTGNPDDRVLEAGKVYDIGFAVFEDKAFNRRHHVTLPLRPDAVITGLPGQ